MLINSLVDVTVLLSDSNKFYIIVIKTLRPSLWRGLHQYTCGTSFLSAEAFPKMPRKESEAVPEGNGLVPQQEELGSGEPTLADVYRLFEERFDKQQKIMDSFFDGMDSCFDRWNRKLHEISDEMRKMDEHVTRLDHGARQPRLAMEADGQKNIKTRERTEGAATAVQAMRGEGFFARRVEPGPNTNSTSFGVKAEPPALP